MTAHWTVLCTVALFADVLAGSVLPAGRPGLVAAVYWLTGVLVAVVFMVTLLAHEVAHAVVARRLGMQVDGITLWMLGGATAVHHDAPTPRNDALVALAGPATSIAAGVLSGLAAFGLGTHTLVGSACFWLAAISVLLGGFNLLPGAPLDGGQVLRSFLWWRWQDRSRAVAATARTGRVLGYAVIGFGFFELAGGSSAGLWLALVGWFILMGAKTSQLADRLSRFSGMRVDAVMTLTADVVNDWWTVSQYLAAQPTGAGDRVLPLVNFAGQATGALTRHDIEQVPAGQRDDIRLRELVARRKPPPALIVARETSLADVAAVLRPHGVAVVVNADRHPLGIVTPADLATAAAVHRQGPRDAGRFAGGRALMRTGDRGVDVGRHH